VLAFTDDQAVRRRLNLRWGVMPFWMPFCTDPEVSRHDSEGLKMLSGHVCLDCPTGALQVRCNNVQEL
jgi:hypothetical protein